MENIRKEKSTKDNVISLAVFIIALVIILINLVSLIFPSLIIMIVSGSEVQDNPFEIGPWAAPLLVTNISILVFGILYYTKKLPSVFPNAIHFIRSFEISPNVATIAFVAILSVYVGLTIPEFDLIEEELYGDYQGKEKRTL